MSAGGTFPAIGENPISLKLVPYEAKLSRYHRCGANLIDCVVHYFPANCFLVAPNYFENSYMQKTCDVAEKAILAKKNLRKKCVNRDKM